MSIETNNTNARIGEMNEDQIKPAILSAERVLELIRDCLYTVEEWPGERSKETMPEGAVISEGIVSRYVFNPIKLAAHKAEIGTLLAELPEQFQAETGGGWSFIHACVDRHGNHWAGHKTLDALVCLGIATGQAQWQFKELMPNLPGGVPYFVVGERAPMSKQQRELDACAEQEDGSSERAGATPGPYAVKYGNNISFVIGGDGLTIAAACGPTRSAEVCRANAALIAHALNNFDPLIEALRDLLDPTGASTGMTPSVRRAVAGLAVAKAKVP